MLLLWAPATVRENNNKKHPPRKVKENKWRNSIPSDSSGDPIDLWAIYFVGSRAKRQAPKCQLREVAPASRVLGAHEVELIFTSTPL